MSDEELSDALSAELMHPDVQAMLHRVEVVCGTDPWNFWPDLANGRKVWALLHEYRTRHTKKKVKRK